MLIHNMFSEQKLFRGNPFISLGPSGGGPLKFVWLVFFSFFIFFSLFSVPLGGMTHHYWFVAYFGEVYCITLHESSSLMNINEVNCIIHHESSTWILMRCITSPLMNINKQRTKAIHVGPLRRTFFDLDSVCRVLPWQNRRGHYFQECHWQDWYI